MLIDEKFADINGRKYRLYTVRKIADTFSPFDKYRKLLHPSQRRPHCDDERAGMGVLENTLTNTRRSSSVLPDCAGIPRARLITPPTQQYLACPYFDKRLNSHHCNSCSFGSSRSGHRVMI